MSPAARPDDLTAREAADALWLAAQVAGRSPVPVAQTWRGAERRSHQSRARDRPTEAGSTEDRSTAVRPGPSSTDLADESEPVSPSDPDLPAKHEPTTATGGLPEPPPATPIAPARVRREPAPERAALTEQALPLVPRLASERELGRSLRPFNRRMPSATETEIDEVATAERAAEEGLWMPALRPAETRWLSIAVVVDASSSMLVWRPTARSFVTLLERQGAFPRVTSYLVDTDRSEPTAACLRTWTGSGDRHDRRQHSDALVRPGQAVLVLTDGVADAWRSGAAARLLASWAERVPVAIVHLLPEYAWHATGLPPTRLRLRATGRAVANRWLQREPAADEPFEPAAVPPEAIPIPLLSLDAAALGWWARLVTGERSSWSEAPVYLADRDPTGTRGDNTEEPDEAEPSEPERPAPTAHESVSRFRSWATPDAFRLATALAAAPLALPMMRLVQSALFPDSRAAHLSEVLVSGLLRRLERPAALVAGAPSGRRTYDVPFEFRDGVRGELLAAARRDETARVLRIIGEHLGTEFSGNIRATLDNPASAEHDPPVTAENAPYVDVLRTATTALGGDYAQIANRLQRALVRLHPPATSPPIPDVTRDTPMPEPATPQAAPEETPPASQRRPGDPPLVWGNIPPRNPVFTGREEQLDQLHRRLQGGATAVLPEALHGLGGVGKSQIAIEYVYRHTADYDLIWWVPAEHPGQIASAMVELAQQMRLPVSSEAITAVPAVRDALRTGRPYRNWLLVFDNAEDPDTVRPYLPTGGPGHALVTSRNRQWANLARSLEVDVFSREESIALLRRRGPDLSDTDADRLAETLGDLPLAIEQAAVWRAETGMPADEYLRLFEEKRAELLEVEMDTTDYKMPVAAAWNVSLDRLRQNHPAALQLLQVCAFFAPEPISRTLFTGVRELPVPDELQSTLRNPIQLGRAIREINRYALARIDHRTNTIQLHRLVQAVLVDQMSPEDQRDMRYAAHLLLVGGDPNDPAPPVQWPRYAMLLPHVLVSRAVESEDLWVRNLVVNVVYYLHNWGDHQAFRDLAQEAYERWQESSGEADVSTLAMARWFGVGLRLLSQFNEARALDEHTLEVLRRTVGDEHELTVLTMNNLAADMRILGDFRAARQLSEQALEIAERAFGEDDPATLVARHNLGVSLRLTGSFGEAFELDEETLRRRTLMYGEDNRSTLNTVNGLGLDEMEAGQYLAARSRLEASVLRCRHILGDDNPDTMLGIRALSVALRRAGDYAAAREASEEALERFRARYGEMDRLTLSAAANVAADLRHNRELEDSKALGERTLEQHREMLGEQHPHTLALATTHAITLRQLGEVEAARELNQRTFEQTTAMLGADHPTTLFCATNLASDLAASDDALAAVDLGKQTLDRLRHRLGEDHPSTLACAANLALDLRAIGRTEEAEPLFEDALARTRRVLGEEHPVTRLTARGERADRDASPLPM